MGNAGGGNTKSEVWTTQETPFADGRVVAGGAGTAQARLSRHSISRNNTWTFDLFIDIMAGVSPLEETRGE